MQKWECTIYSYVYNPVRGDFIKIAAGSIFENLPENWVCPNWGAAKDMFEPVK